VRASEVLREARGDCHSKGVLFTALCRAAELPARLLFVDVRPRFLHGILDGAPEVMPHAVGQVHLDGRLVVDRRLRGRPGLFALAKQMLRDEELDCGWGVVAGATGSWDGRSHCLHQFREADVVHSHGAFDDPAQFYATCGRGSHDWLGRLRYALGAQLVNRRVRKLRERQADRPRAGAAQSTLASAITRIEGSWPRRASWLTRLMFLPIQLAISTTFEADGDLDAGEVAVVAQQVGQQFVERLVVQALVDQDALGLVQFALAHRLPHAGRDVQHQPHVAADRQHFLAHQRIVAHQQQPVAGHRPGLEHAELAGIDLDRGQAFQPLDGAREFQPHALLAVDGVAPQDHARGARQLREQHPRHGFRRAGWTRVSRHRARRSGSLHANGIPGWRAPGQLLTFSHTVMAAP
jgi:hypothetical protein